MLFHIQPQTAYINDINKDLMCVYSVIKHSVDELINKLKTFKNTQDEFYIVRNLDRNKKSYNSLSEIDRAARIIFK